MHGAILIVDDDLDQLSLFHTALLPLRAPIITCVDGAEAVQLVRSQEIDVILLDFILPGLNGIDVIRRLRTLETRLPRIILATGMDCPSFKESAMAAGVDDVLVKPFDIDTLTSIVANLRAMSIDLRRKSFAKAG